MILRVFSSLKDSVILKTVVKYISRILGSFLLAVHGKQLVYVASVYYWIIQE